MIVAIVILSVLCAVLIGLLSFAGFQLWRLGKTVLAFIDATEKCLDVLNLSYAKMYEILQTPVGSDDPLIRSVVSEIKRAHDAVLIVAHTLANSWSTSDEEDEDKDEEEDAI